MSVLLISGLSYGAFYDMGQGARPIGLGNAFVAVADDANAMYYNISGISQLKEITSTATYSSYFLGISDSYISAVVPIHKAGAIGVSWLNTRANLYSENTITLGYSYPVDRAISFGLGVKMLLKNYSTDLTASTNPVFNKTSASNFAVDLSLLAKLLDEITLGISVENINTPDIGLASPDLVARNYRGGLTYRLAKDLIITSEATYRRAELKTHLGLEYWIGGLFLDSMGIKNGNIGFRGGVSYGTSSYLNASAGFSFFLPTNFVDVRFDYSFTLPFNFVDGSSTHRITINIAEPKPLFNI